MIPHAHAIVAAAAIAALLLAFAVIRRFLGRRRVEVSDSGLIVDRMFSFGWRDIRRLDFWIEKGVARYVVHLGASKYGFANREATLNDPLKLKHLIIERSRLEKEKGPDRRVETFVRHGDTGRIPGGLLEMLPRPSSPGIVGAVVGAAVLWLSRAKWIATALSLLASLGAYRLLHLSWTFASGMLGVVLIHELGHAWVMRAHGLRAGAPVFLPFVGAMIALRDQPRDAKVEAEIGYGGPLAGAFASTICFVVFYVTQRPAWLAVAAAGYLINLFNMIPVTPLDGGRIAAAITPRLWLVGIGGITLFFALSWQEPAAIPVNILLLFVASSGIGNAWEAWRNPQKFGQAAYYNVSAGYRLAMAFAYFILAAFLGWMLYTSAAMLGIAGLRV